MPNDCFPIWINDKTAKAILVPSAIASSAMGFIRYGMALKDSSDLLPLTKLNKFNKFNTFNTFDKFNLFSKFNIFNKLQLDSDEQSHDLHQQDWW